MATYHINNITVDNPYGEYSYNPFETDEFNYYNKKIESATPAVALDNHTINIIAGIEKIQQVLGNINDYENGFYNFSTPVLQTLSNLKQDVYTLEYYINNNLKSELKEEIKDELKKELKEEIIKELKKEKFKSELKIVV